MIGVTFPIANSESSMENDDQSFYIFNFAFYIS